jgi:glycosyltransferase involved in cell wall biosynthesis
VLSCATQYRPSPASVAAIRRELGGGPIIGHVGALVDRHKGQSILLEAFSKLLNEFPQARLLFVGDGPDRAHLERLAKDNPRICFAGFREDVGPWIAAMDIFAFPSREEGLGSSVLDAMALGVPVVVSPVGGLPELVGKNQRGLVMDQLDADSLFLGIQALLRDPALRQQLATEARVFALRHDADEMAGQYLQVYHAILSQEMRSLGWIDV